MNNLLNAYDNCPYSFNCKAAVRKIIRIWFGLHLVQFLNGSILKWIKNLRVL